MCNIHKNIKRTTFRDELPWTENILANKLIFDFILKIGITLPQAGHITNKENVIRMALMAEEDGFNSVWVLSNLLWPIKPQTPISATPDGRLPEEYQIMLDPLQTLGLVSANINKILLGTCV